MVSFWFICKQPFNKTFSNFLIIQYRYCGQDDFVMPFADKHKMMKIEGNLHLIFNSPREEIERTIIFKVIHQLKQIQFFPQNIGSSCTSFSCEFLPTLLSGKVDYF